MAEAEVCDKIYCSSDWHNPPDKLKESVVVFLEQAKRCQAEVEKEGKRVLVVGVGDLFDLVIHGWKAFISCQAIQQFAEGIEGLEFVYVAGNHDPLRWVSRIMNALHQPLKVVPHYSLEVDGQEYYFVHGHQWEVKARWIRLWIPLLIWLTSWAPGRRLVQWWNDRVSPTPGRLKSRMKRLEAQRETLPRDSLEWNRMNRSLGGERERYNQAIGWVHGGAGRYAETNECVVISGHTHKPWKAHAFEGAKPMQRMHDDGDLVDSCTYLVIEGSTVTLRRLEGRCKAAKPKPESWFDKVTDWALVAGSAGALLGLAIALISILISISTLLCRYPSLPGWVASAAGKLLVTGLVVLVVGCVLDQLARKLRPSDRRIDAKG